MKNLLKFLVGLYFFYSSTLHAELFKADEFFLDNGLQVVVVENHKAPLVEHMLVYKVGSVDNISGKAGGAHLLEHLMFRGTKNVKDGEFNRIMEDNGAISNAYTSYDVTAYHQFADVSRLEILMALEADRMQNLSFDENAFHAEQKIVLQERKQVIENNPASEYNERFRRMVYNDSPYGWPITGTEDEIKALDFKDMMDFYHNFYVPNNAVLVLSGDITKDEVRSLVEKYYGSILSKEVVRKEPAEEGKKFNAKLEMSLPNISAVTFNKKYLLPNFRKIKGNGYAYFVLSKYLGGGKTSALYRDLVRDKKLAVSVSAGYSHTSRGNTSFSIYAVLQDETGVNEFRKSLRDSLYNAIEKFDEKELEIVKKKIIADLIYAKDNPADAADTFGYMLGVGFSVDDVQNYDEKIKKVSLTDVKDAFNEVFENAAETEGVLFPQKGEY